MFSIPDITQGKAGPPSRLAEKDAAPHRELPAKRMTPREHGVPP